MQLIILLLLAGLGLAQEPTKLKVRGTPDQRSTENNWPKQFRVSSLTEDTQAVIRTTEVKPEDRVNRSGNLLIGDPLPHEDKMQVAGRVYLGGVTDTPFAMQADGLPEVIVIVNRKGTPLVRCVAKTQTCELIKTKEPQ